MTFIAGTNRNIGSSVFRKNVKNIPDIRSFEGSGVENFYKEQFTPERGNCGTTETFQLRPKYLASIENL